MKYKCTWSYQHWIKDKWFSCEDHSHNLYTPFPTLQIKSQIRFLYFSIMTLLFLHFNGNLSNILLLQASVKNFQLCHSHNPEVVIMQLGKVDQDTFIMDFRSVGFLNFDIWLSFEELQSPSVFWPLNMLQVSSVRTPGLRNRVIQLRLQAGVRIEDPISERRWHSSNMGQACHRCCCWSHD